MSVGLVGKSLAGRYDVLALLGEGGMGAVYRARDRELDEVVALKVIRAELARDPEIVERFRSEVKLARRVTHANVARTFELGNADGVLFCTMELVDGESLTHRLARAPGRRLAIAEAVAIAAELCDGLAAAHAVDVVHRDVKPDNVLLASDGRVVVADFGVAAVRAPVRQDVSGTPAYMAPEQAMGEPPSPATDVYAVGVVLYEMLTGRRAFIGEVTQILAEKVTLDRVQAGPGELPAELAGVIGNATAREPAERYATAGELRRALAPWVGAEDPAAAPLPHAAQTRAAAEAGPEVGPEATTISVIAPSGDGDKAYLADAVYDEVVTLLAKLPRVRVRPRPDPDAEIAVTFAVGAELGVEICRGGVAVARLHVPLAIQRIEHAAEGIADAVASAVALAEISATDARLDYALDLMYRARHLAMRVGPGGAQQAMALLEQAIATAPDDPRIAARLAISQVRLAFFAGNFDPGVFERGARMARAALAAQPGLEAAHLALGHVELNVGDVGAAAGHFRMAIACAPHSAEAHEQLGALLLEAGYLEPALARLREAAAINPSTRHARWEIARALALEGRWPEHDALIGELLAEGSDRMIARARYAWWRRDEAKLVALRAQLAEFQRGFLGLQTVELVQTFLDGDAAWPENYGKLAGLFAVLAPHRRRRALIAQMVAEAAGYHGDVDAALALIAQAISDGLFDLHWLDRCPLLAGARADPRLAPLRAQIKSRADAILDALYGDHQLGTSDTVIASRY